MVDGRRARTTTTTKTRRRSPATGGTFGSATVLNPRVPSADSVIAASEVARRLRANAREQTLPLTVLSTVTKVCVPGAGWVPADAGTVAVFRGTGERPGEAAAWLTFRSDGEAITLPLAGCALKEARR